MNKLLATLIAGLFVATAAIAADAPKVEAKPAAAATPAVVAPAAVKSEVKAVAAPVATAATPATEKAAEMHKDVKKEKHTGEKHVKKAAEIPAAVVAPAAPAAK